MDSGVSVGRRLTGEGCRAQEKPVGTFFCSIDAPYCKKWTVYQQTENYKSLVSPDLLNKLSLLQKLFRLTPSIRLLSLFFAISSTLKKGLKTLVASPSNSLFYVKPVFIFSRGLINSSCSDVISLIKFPFWGLLAIFTAFPLHWRKLALKPQ